MAHLHLEQTKNKKRIMRKTEKKRRYSFFFVLNYDKDTRLEEQYLPIKKGLTLSKLHMIEEVRREDARITRVLPAQSEN